MSLTPLGDTLRMRPKPLVWTLQDSAWHAPTALGMFIVSPVPSTSKVASQGLWYPSLNYAPFPVLAPSPDEAKNLAVLGQIVHGDLISLSLVWQEEHGTHTAQGYDAQGRPTQWTIQASHGTPGWFALRNHEPSYVALADADQAQAACAQYAAYVWLALSDVVGAG